MLNFCSLYSGSSGNSFFIQNDDTNILIDAGVSSKKIVEALEGLNINPSSIDALLITHEHIDHTKSLATFSNKFNIPIYANEKTWAAMHNFCEKLPPKNICKFTTNKSFKINSFEIFPFQISHDAADPCGFNIFYNSKKISIATDLGIVSDNTLNFLKDSNFVLLESNYDPNILKLSSYPYNLKQRISSNLGHLSNINAGKALAKLADNGLKEALLIHLSKENNFPELAYQTVMQEISQKNDFTLSVAPRNNPSKLFKIS